MLTWRLDISSLTLLTPLHFMGTLLVPSYLKTAFIGYSAFRVCD